MHIGIIGAGFSGLLAAYLLEQSGYRVTVMERQEHLGGHCRTLQHKDLSIELGTVFCIPGEIKALLSELGVSYSERFSYRNFVDDAFSPTEQIPRASIKDLLRDLQRLEELLANAGLKGGRQYGPVPEVLTQGLLSFLESHQLHALAEALAPHLSGFGFGSIHQLPAYYALKIFDQRTLNAFIKGEKLLFVDKGFSEVVLQLSRHISDIRYGIQVRRIAEVGQKVQVETDYETALFDHVLVSARLEPSVLADSELSNFMAKVATNPYVSLAYKVEENSNVTTYYKGQLGRRNRLQFFHTFKQGKKTVLVAYAYGTLSKALVTQVTEDITRVGIPVKHLIAAKDWQMFPHLPIGELAPDSYTQLLTHQRQRGLWLFGSLTTKPAISTLYGSVQETVDQLMTLKPLRHPI